MWAGREPRGRRGAAQGGTIDGLSTAIGLEITVANGRIEQSNFDGYPLLRMPDAPRVETHVCPSTLTPVGAGEMGIPSAAPALANAIFAADRQAPAQSAAALSGHVLQSLADSGSR